MSTASAVVTVRRTEPEIVEQLRWAEPPLHDEGTTISYRPAPGDRGTEIRVTVRTSTPGGRLGEKVAAVVGSDPQRRLDDALRRFKQLLETGEVLRSDADPQGIDARQQRHQHAAAPGGAENADDTAGDTAGE